MLFGFELRPSAIVLGGLFLAALLTFQVLQGKRIIRFKGPLFMKVHRTSAWIMVAAALIHAFFALTYLQGWRIG